MISKLACAVLVLGLYSACGDSGTSDAGDSGVPALADATPVFADAALLVDSGIIRDAAPIALDATPVDSGHLLLSAVAGDRQTGIILTTLPAPVVVRVSDEAGHPVAGISVGWTGSAGARASPRGPTTAADGTLSATVTLGRSSGFASVTATASGALAPVTFTFLAIHGLVYRDPPPGGKLRLVNAPGSTPAAIRLALIAGAPLTGYYVGLNLPIDAARVQLDPQAGLTVGDALDPGPRPFAARALIATQGPLSGVLVSGLSQKASQQPADAPIAFGAVFYTIQLDVLVSGLPGTVFDGAQLTGPLGGGLRDRTGTDQATAREIAIGRLELR